MPQRLSQAWAGLRGEHRPDAEYYSSHAGIGISGSIPVDIDKISAIPLLIGKERTIDRIAVGIVTESVGKNAYLGIYEDDGNLLPGDLFLDAGTISVGATGVFAATVDKVIPPGLYWCVILPEDDIFVRGETYSIPLLGCLATDLITTYKWWAAPQAYGALPASFPGSPVKQSIISPKILVRFSA